MILTPERRLVLLAVMIWGMPEHASVGDLKRKILASDAMAGRPLISAVPDTPQDKAA